MSGGLSILLHTSDSVVGIATGYGLNGSGIKHRWRWDFCAPVRTGPGTHPDFYTTGTVLFPGEKRPRRDVNHPCHLAARLNKEYNYTSTSSLACSRLPPCLFKEWSFKHRDKLTYFYVHIWSLFNNARNNHVLLDTCSLYVFHDFTLC
jgi:hypothetical protein